MCIHTIGIDPDKKGGISVIHEDHVEIFATPLMDQPWSKPKKVLKKGIWTGKYKTKQMIDHRAFARIIAQYKSGANRICLEPAQPRPNDGKVGSFSNGGSFYAIVAILTVMGLEKKIQYVHPIKWKTKWDLIKCEKDASRLLAISMFPYLSHQLRFKYTHGLSDAIFIAL